MNDHMYIISGPNDYVFRTFFNFSNRQGQNIDFAEDATGQVLITLDRGRFRHQGGEPTTITLLEDTPENEPYWFDCYCGDDWFNTACNQYYEWYHRVRPWRLTVVDSNHFIIKFRDILHKDIETPDLHVYIGPLPPGDELTDQEKKMIEELQGAV